MFLQEMFRRIRVMKLLSVLGVAALLLQGCGIPFTSEAFHETPEAKYLHLTLERVAAQDYAAIEAAFDPRVKQADMRQALQQVHALLPKEAPVGRERVQWNVQIQHNTAGEGTNGRIANVAVQYAYPSSRWILASAALSGEPGNFRLVGFHVQPLSASLADTNAFTLLGKDLGHYVFLLLMLVSVGIALLALVACIRTRGLKRKWLWAVCTLAGLSSFTLNWTTGETAFQMVHASILGWGALRQGWIGAWNLSFPIPLGALVFLWRLGRHQPPDAPAESAVDAGAPG